MVKEKAYAKVNMALEVMEVQDGYHLVNNIMIPIDLYDELCFSKADRIYVKDNEIEDNICVKAARLFMETYGIDGGVCIELKKNIPLQAGLAGGSSDAAATLRGLNRLFHIGAGNEELKKLGAKLGSDVPFFIETRPALCRHRGEMVEPFCFEISKWKVLLVKPKIGLSTKEVYQRYVYGNKRKDKEFNAVIEGLRNGDLEKVKAYIFNDLKEPALSLSKGLKMLYNKLEKIGQVYLSGSGPTMYFIEPTEEEIRKVEELNVYTKVCFFKL